MYGRLINYQIEALQVSLSISTKAIFSLSIWFKLEYCLSHNLKPINFLLVQSSTLSYHQYLLIGFLCSSYLPEWSWGLIDYERTSPRKVLSWILEVSTSQLGIGFVDILGWGTVEFSTYKISTRCYQVHSGGKFVQAKRDSVQLFKSGSSMTSFSFTTQEKILLLEQYYPIYTSIIQNLFLTYHQGLFSTLFWCNNWLEDRAPINIWHDLYYDFIIPWISIR